MKVSGRYVHDRPAQFVFLSLSRVLRYCLSCAHPRGQCGKTAEKKKKKSYSQHKERIKENKLRTSSGRSDSRAPFQKLKRCCRGWGEKILFRLLLFWQRISSSIPADPHRLNFALSSLIPKTHKAPQCFLRIAVYLRKVCLVYINIIETSLSFSSANEKGGNDVYIKGYSHFLLCFCFHFSLSLSK